MKKLLYIIAGNKMTIVHISDSHGDHNLIKIPPCDVLIHSGDLGGRTTLKELTLFLTWFNAQPATVKIFIGGNHDLCLDPNWYMTLKAAGQVYGTHKAIQDYNDAKALIANYENITYLCNSSYVHEGIVFWGSPYTPSFHRNNWAFNADRGAEISKHWSRIPSDVNVLITHGPPMGVLDLCPRANGTFENAGCADLMAVIKKRLLRLQLHSFGHLHGNTGIIQHPVSHTRNVLFSNGAVLNNEYKPTYLKPLIITI